MAGHPKLSRIMVHLKAETPEELQQLQFENNVRNGREFSYVNFSFVDGLWYCWYAADIEHEVKPPRRDEE